MSFPAGGGGGGGGGRGRSGKLSAVCPCARRHQGSQHHSSFRHQCARGGRSARGTTRRPQTHQQHKVQSPKPDGSSSCGSAQLFLLPDPLSRVRTKCDLQTRLAGAAGGGHGTGPGLGGAGQLAPASPPSPHPWRRRQQRQEQMRVPEKQGFSTPGSQGANSVFRCQPPGAST